jgi:hypothetical protein
LRRVSVLFCVLISLSWAIISSSPMFFNQSSWWMDLLNWLSDLNADDESTTALVRAVLGNPQIRSLELQSWCYFSTMIWSSKIHK